jgi:hypothetical protein
MPWLGLSPKTIPSMRRRNSASSDFSAPDVPTGFSFACAM